MLRLCRVRYRSRVRSTPALHPERREASVDRGSLVARARAQTDDRARRVSFRSLRLPFSSGAIRTAERLDSRRRGAEFLGCDRQSIKASRAFFANADLEWSFVVVCHRADDQLAGARVEHFDGLAREKHFGWLTIAEVGSANAQIRFLPTLRN